MPTRKKKDDTKVAVEKKEKKKGEFHVSIQTAGKEIEADVDNVGEFIVNCGVDFTNTMTKITISKGKNKIDRIFNAVRSRALFNNTTRAELFANSVTKLLSS